MRILYPFNQLASWWRVWHKPKTLGERGEEIAARYLRKLGYKIIGLRVAVGRGDIDLVAIHGRTVVFVEVKTRTSPDAGGPLGAVGYSKQKRLTQLALQFLKQHQLLEYSARFDVIAVVWPEGQRRPHIEHVPSAFEAVDASGYYS